VKPNGTLFSVTNPAAATFLSFTMSTSTANPDCAQACGRPSVQTLWNITLNANKLGYKFVCVSSFLLSVFLTTDQHH
jgi:hypothetical protein